jgi:hypothetical protein
MMNLLKKEDLKTLLDKQDDHSISIFMPTYRGGSETRQNPIRFKNLLRRAEKHLRESGFSKPEVKELLAPGLELLPDDDFWQHQLDGLAVFLSGKGMYHYRVPLTLKELVVVTGGFHFKPLLPLLVGDGRFYMLALSQHHVRLLLCTRYTVDEIPLEGVPRSLEEALQFDDFEKQLQFHSGSAGRSGGRAAVFHGRGTGKEDSKENIRRYFQLVDDGLQRYLREEHVPLILAGVDYLLAIYRRENHYTHLLEDKITGNPEELSDEELQRRAAGIVVPLFSRAHRAALERYRELKNKNLTSSDLDTVVKAAYNGRVETLFVAVGVQQWGQFDPQKNEVQLHQTQNAASRDLLDLAAAQTLVKGGTVFAVKPEIVPDDGPIAAIFRY